MSKNILLTDVGGTHIRFACYNGRECSSFVRYKIQEFQTFKDAVNAYLSETEIIISAMVVGAAGLRCNNRVCLTNHTWIVDALEIKKQLNLEQVILLNDFTLQGLGTLDCQESDLLHLGKECPIVFGPRVVIGAGTGLGVCFLMPNGENDFTVCESEAGHTTLGVVTKSMHVVAQKAWEKVPHLSFERLVSGQGIMLLYQIIGENYTEWQETVLFDEIVKMKQAYNFIMPTEKSGEWIPVTSGSEITVLAEQGNEIALMTWWLFFKYLGVFCSNMALTLKTSGGVYLVGDILTHPMVKQLLMASRIRSTFEKKGRFKSFMENIPLILVDKKNIPLLGLLHIAKRI